MIGLPRLCTSKALCPHSGLRRAKSALTWTQKRKLAEGVAVERKDNLNANDIAERLAIAICHYCRVETRYSGQERTRQLFRRACLFQPHHQIEASRSPTSRTPPVVMESPSSPVFALVKHLLESDDSEYKTGPSSSVGKKPKVAVAAPSLNAILSLSASALANKKKDELVAIVKILQNHCASTSAAVVAGGASSSVAAAAGGISDAELARKVEIRVSTLSPSSSSDGR